MEFVLATLVAFNPLDPLVALLRDVILPAIYGVVHNYGWSFIVLALLVKLAMWPLNTMQFKSMISMQELQPKIKALQAKYKNDREKLNEATMALYKEKGANPLAGCLPLLLQLPVIYSVFFAINSNKERFAKEHWLWIGTPFAINSPYHFLAASLANLDYLLLGLYIVSMYFSVRFTSPPSPDPAVAQQQKIMAFVSPVMIGVFGFKAQWPSGLLIYWLSFNIFTMGQQIYLIRRYRRNPSAAGDGGGGGGALTAGAVPVIPVTPGVALASNGAKAQANNGGGSRAARRRRSSRR